MAAQGVAVQQDRRTRMVQSSMHAPAKKGGAGGSYTWGGVMDVTDYHPVGLNGASNVSVAHAPMVTAAPAQMMQQHAVNIADHGHFPTLAPSPSMYSRPAFAAQPAAFAAQPVVWGEGVVAAARATTVTSNIQGIIAGHEPRMEAFDATHPRNTFARKPAKVLKIDEIPMQTAAPQAIDWSSIGMVPMQQAMLHAAAYPGTLGPALQEKHLVPLGVVRANGQVAPGSIVPKMMAAKGYTAGKPVYSQPKPRMLQARAR